MTTNWRGHGFSSLPNLYADTAAGMIDRHNYAGGGGEGHYVAKGKVSTFTHLEHPGHGLLAVGLSQVTDRPFGVSEWSMLPPCAFKAEAAPLMAFYGLGLQGWDASYHFACGKTRLTDGWNRGAKYNSATPHYMGQFPALAFAVHNNHIQEGEVVASRAVGEKEIFAAKDVLKQSLAGSHDLKTISKDAVTPPEALAVGKVLIDFKSKKSIEKDLSSYWDKKSKIINSTTGQLKWNYGDKIVEVRSEKTQAIIGQAGGKTIQLPDAEVKVKTPFVSLIFTPLDNKPLKSSKNILITAMARDKQTGTVYNDDWSELKVVGKPPLLMEPVQASIKLSGKKIKAVKALDIYGVPTGKEAKVGADGSFTIDGTYQVYYYQIKR
ncbi:MAG: hypothetical protein HRU15_05700 [Planctomycetes bacterium]|nr:hypothetical protein [Planctomycetota bacterium]